MNTPALFRTPAARAPRQRLRCQRCGNRRRSTEESARAAGWRVWTGPTAGGHTARVVLCPCVA